MFPKVLALVFAAVVFISGTSGTAHGGVGHHVVKREEHSGDGTSTQ